MLLSDLVLSSRAQIRRLNSKVLENYPSALTNPSIAFYNSKLFATVRAPGYILLNSPQGKTFDPPEGPRQFIRKNRHGLFNRLNYLLELDVNLNTVQTWLIDEDHLSSSPIVSNGTPSQTVLEDGRLVVWNEELYLIGSSAQPGSNFRQMSLSRLIIDQTKPVVKSVDRRLIMPKDYFESDEKNWAPIIDKPFSFLRNLNPTQIVHTSISNEDEFGITEISPTTELEAFKLRGGSQIVRWGNGYLAVSHTTKKIPSWNGTNRIYKHQFVSWDLDFQNMKMSSDFSFLGGAIEFCAGITFSQGDVLISFGLNDNIPYVLRMPVATIEEIMSI